MVANVPCGFENLFLWFNKWFTLMMLTQVEVDKIRVESIDYAHKNEFGKVI